jgi:hypothetical protein
VRRGADDLASPRAAQIYRRIERRDHQTPEGEGDETEGSGRSRATSRAAKRREAALTLASAGAAPAAAGCGWSTCIGSAAAPAGWAPPGSAAMWGGGVGQRKRSPSLSVWRRLGGGRLG